MGADIYLMSEYTKNKKKYESDFKKACNNRNNALIIMGYRTQSELWEKGSNEMKEKYSALQEEVTRIFDLMYSKGYFRDSYNDSSLLWKFGLSWWELVRKNAIEVKNERILPTGAVKKFLKQLADNEVVFENNLKLMEKHNQEYFVEKYEELKEFCKKAIKTREGLSCSV